MNKKRIDKNIDRAYQALSQVGIANNNVISKTFRGQISTFGAAVTMGSLLSAIAFFSEKGSASNDRCKLMQAISYILNLNNYSETAALYRYAQERIKNGRENACREDILNAAISIKLAMNLYELKKEG